MQKYSVNQQLIETVLAWVKAGEIAIPEIQRPFVWDSSKVRDLMDSLYQGYPVGYLIAWKNPDGRLKDGSKSGKDFLSKDILVRDLIAERGDISHLFPRNYLKKNGLKRSKYNQIANYVYMQSEINIKIGNRPPKEYFGLIQNQIQTFNPQISGITNEAELSDNLQMNCVPAEIMEMELQDYQEFLAMRRKLMAEKIRLYL